VWQVVHNLNITTTIHFVEFSVVEFDLEFHSEYGCLYPMFAGKLQRSRLPRDQTRVRRFYLDKQ